VSPPPAHASSWWRLAGWYESGPLTEWVITRERPSCDGQRHHANGSRGRTQDTTALDKSALLDGLEALKAVEVGDRSGTVAVTIYRALIEAEPTAVIGTAPHERTNGRTAQRNGSRPCTLSTTAGPPVLRIPQLRACSSFSAQLERRRIDQALFAVVREASLLGAWTRTADHLVKPWVLIRSVATVSLTRHVVS
jgi:hypothetical protein